MSELCRDSGSHLVVASAMVDYMIIIATLLEILYMKHACFNVFHAWMHVSCMIHAWYMHKSTIPCMERAWFSLPCMIHAWACPFHACIMHGKENHACFMHEPPPSMHEACMVLLSMHDTCMEGTPDTVNNNFGSKNSKQLQRTAAQIFSNFCEVCMEE